MISVLLPLSHKPGLLNSNREPVVLVIHLRVKLSYFSVKNRCNSESKHSWTYWTTTKHHSSGLNRDALNNAGKKWSHTRDLSICRNICILNYSSFTNSFQKPQRCSLNNLFFLRAPVPEFLMRRGVA